jgi:hypothetical protein
MKRHSGEHGSPDGADLIRTNRKAYIVTVRMLFRETNPYE